MVTFGYGTKKEKTVDVRLGQIRRILRTAGGKAQRLLIIAANQDRMRLPTDRLSVMHSNRIYTAFSRLPWWSNILLAWAILFVCPYSFLLIAGSRRQLITDYPMLVLVLILAPLHRVIFIRLWKQVDITFQQSHRDGLCRPSSEDFDLKSFVSIFNSRFNHRYINIFLTCLSGLVGVALVWERLRASERLPKSSIPCWGCSSLYGFVAACFITSMISYELLQLNYKGIITIQLLRKELGYSLRLNPLHSDGVYGLAEVAKIFLLTYAIGVVHWLGVLTLWLGRFISERWSIGLITVLIAVLTPIFFGFPFFAIRRQILAFKSETRNAVRDALRQFSDTRTQWSVSSSESRLLVPIKVYEPLAAASIDALPNHPFPNHAVALGLFGYFLQITSAVVFQRFIGWLAPHQ